MNEFRKLAAAALAAIGTLAVSGAAVAAPADRSPAPSAIAAVESDPLLHSPVPSLLGNVPAASMYHATANHAAPSSVRSERQTPRASMVPGRSETIRLQRALNRDGAGLKLSGVMDQHTMTALLNYQSDHGLAPNGALDGVTKKILNIG